MRKLIITAVFAILTGTSSATDTLPPPLPPVHWEAEVDPRFDPPVERIVIEAKNPIDKETLQSYWQSWGLEATGLLQSMMDAPRWQGYRYTIAAIFYACPIEAAQPILHAELNRRADAFAEAADSSLKPSAGFDQHLWAVNSYAPHLLNPLLEHQSDWIKLQAANALVRNAQSIPPLVEPVVEAFARSDDVKLQSFALSILRSPPTKANKTRAAELEASINAKKAQESANLEVRLSATSGPATIRGIVVNAQEEPQHGLHVTLWLTDFRTGGDAGKLNAITGPDGVFEFSAKSPGRAKIHQVQIHRRYELSDNSSGSPSETCLFLEPVSDFDVYPGSTIDGLRLVVEVPEPSFITGTITDESGTPLKASLSFIVAPDTFPGQTHYQVFNGSFIGYALPRVPFAIQFTLDGHQARILQAGRDFEFGDRDITVVLPSTPYPEDQPLWTTITGTPWTQDSVDASVQGTMIRHNLESLRSIQSAPKPEPRATRDSGPFGEVSVQQLFDWGLRP